MLTVYTHFSNHFDLVWRRAWDRDYLYEGGRYASYRRIEELCLLRNIDLARPAHARHHLDENSITSQATER